MNNTPATRAALNDALQSIISVRRALKHRVFQTDSSLFRDRLEFDEAWKSCESDLARRAVLTRFARATAQTARQLAQAITTTPEPIAPAPTPVADPAAGAPMVAA